ncbi:unnamed protein product [Knipowitschia caucasica]
MAKAIYALKIWMFRDQFRLTIREEKGIRDICLFTVRLYITAWYRSPEATSAPRLDLQLLKDLDAYKTQHPEISKIAVKKLQGHLWYLSEELVALAFFDDEVRPETKVKMVQSLNNVSDQIPMKRATVDCSVIQEKKLEDFVTFNTRRFFSITGLPSHFLQNSVSEWEHDDEFKTIKSTVRSMKVVNDIAERGVALMDEYNRLHTNKEEQKQFLLLVVHKYRHKYPDRKKTTLMSD